jgi:hypothetical protein
MAFPQTFSRHLVIHVPTPPKTPSPLILTSVSSQLHFRLDTPPRNFLWQTKPSKSRSRLRLYRQTVAALPKSLLQTLSEDQPVVSIPIPNSVKKRSLVDTRTVQDVGSGKMGCEVCSA